MSSKLLLLWATAISCLACLVVFAVLGMGAWTRLSDAGLGCPDWPLCYGHLIMPNTQDQIDQANSQFAATPFERAKAIPEVVHRGFAAGFGFLSLIVFALLVLATRAETEPRLRRKIPVVAAGNQLFLVLMQGLLGWLTVSQKLWPPVVVAHLMGGMIIWLIQILLTIRLFHLNWLNKHSHAASGHAPSGMGMDGAVDGHRLPAVQGSQVSLAGLLLLGILLTLGQIGLGGWTSANYAALACPDFPLCQGAVIPPMDLADGFELDSSSEASTLATDYLGGLKSIQGRTAIHFVHRLGALILTLFTLAVGMRMLSTAKRHPKLPVPLTLLAYLLLGSLLLQLGVGVTATLTIWPLTLGVLHNLGAAILIGIYVLCLQFLALADLGQNTENRSLLGSVKHHPLTFLKA